MIAFSLIIALAASLFVWRSFQPKAPFLRIPIVFTDGKPCINVKLEGSEYLFQLDSGSFGCFSTHKKEIIEKIKNKTALEPTKWMDVKGNEYLSPTFTVKRIDIETFQMFNAIIEKEDLNFIANGSNLTSSVFEETNRLENISGRLGIRTLRVLDYWLIDFPHSAIFAIRDIEKIKDIPGFSFEEFTEVNLEKNKNYIMISVDTDFGPKRLILDTGASHSIISPPSAEYSNHQILKTDRFVIGDRDFGKTEFYLFHPAEAFSCDGFLGRDFFQQHAIYLDFKKNRVFIGP